jgi:CheY-like chemotaxis protein
MPKKRIFVVDDSSSVRSMVRQLFESETNCEIVGEAENGRDAVAKAAFAKPDLIVLDLNMPVMGGLDAAPFLRKVLPDTRLILFTVSQGQEVEQQALAAGIQTVVSKYNAASELVPRAQALLTAQGQG